MTTLTETTTKTDRLRIDFLFLDLDTCTRCRGTDRSLEKALETVRELLAATGTEVELNKIHVESAEQARELRLRSSPTIRVGGHDIALELRESSCASEACTDGCGESIACRVWVHRGEEYTEPPVAMIVDPILREIHHGAAVEGEPDDESYQLSANLERFFAGKAAAEAQAGVAADELVQATCCLPVEQRTCCEPEDKAECCAASPGSGCGCR